VKGNWREGSLAGDPGGYAKRLWRWASLSIWAPLGNLEGGSSTGNFERWLKGTLEKGRLSLKRLTAEGLKGGLLYWGPWVMSGRLWTWASVFMEAQLGKLEWAHLLGTLGDG